MRNKKKEIHTKRKAPRIISVLNIIVGVMCASSVVIAFFLMNQNGFRLEIPAYVIFFFVAGIGGMCIYIGVKRK